MNKINIKGKISVEDPGVLGPPGSGSISQRYRSGSGSISQRYRSGSGSFPFFKKMMSGLK
jgi:hypothetical protein